MIGDEALLLDGLRRLVGQEASITPLRTTLFLCAVFAAFSWVRRRPFVALSTLTVCGSLGLGYWLAQIVSPMGFATDPSLTRAWAQAGVNVLAEPKGSGFIWGTEPEISLVSGLASAGIPLGLVALAPQAAAMLALGLVVLAPFGFRGSRTTATLAASLALGGGLWPGPVPYGSVLLRPSALLLSGMLLGGLWLLGRAQAARRAFHRFRLEIAGGLVAAATLDRALAGGAEPGATAALLLSGAAMILASPLRAALRRISSSAAMARRAEALCLLCSFGGSGLLWWDPPHSVAGFNEARDENASLQESMGWIRRNVPKNAVVLASPEYSAPIAAFGGRRVLFPPPADAALISLREPFRRTRLSESTRLGQPLARLAEAFSVTHLFLGPGEIDPPARTEASGTTEARLKLELVYQDAKDFRVFRLARK